MGKTFIFCSLIVLIGLVGSARAEGDSIFLFATNPGLAGSWGLALNSGGALPTDPISGGSVVFNDASKLPDPNNPLVGDVNGDGMPDIVTVGTDGSSFTVFQGRNTDAIAGVGNLGIAPIARPGFPDNWAVNFDTTVTDTLLADVDGDGADDAITIKPNPADANLAVWEAFHSDSDGLEGNAPTTSFSGGLARADVMGTFTPLVGDFNGDGADDILMRNPSQASDAIIVGQVSTPGVGLDSANPTFWGSLNWHANSVATLVGDIDGDGRDDIVEVDDRFGSGNLVWAAGLTRDIDPLIIPAGIGINTVANGNGNDANNTLSWAFPFTLDPASTLAVPLLADINDDGRDDLVLYEEFIEATTGNIFGRMLVSYTDDPRPGGGLFANVFDDATFFDYTAIFGVDGSGMVPFVGNVHVPVPTVLGDMDGNGMFDVDDIDDMVLYLEDPVAYGSTHPGLDPIALGDFNGDLSTDTGDLAGFIPVLNGLANPIAPGTDTVSAVPEPASLVLLGMGLVGLVICGWRKRCVRRWGTVPLGDSR